MKQQAAYFKQSFFLQDGFLLFISSLFYIIFFILLHAGLYPTVFADEWFYSSSARLLPLTKSLSPSYIFLLTFKLTNYWGNHFLVWARILNACFFSLSLPFIYLTARLFTTRGLAFFISIVSLIAPIHSYTAYFMPESLYFFAFWIFTWFVLSNQQNALRLGFGAGIMLCILSLIKMHGLFLLPAFVIFIFSSKLNRSKDGSLYTTVLIVCNTLFTFFALRLTFGYLFAGPNGFNFLGEKYTYQLYSVFQLQRLTTTLQHISTPLFGHFLSLSLLFGLPVILLWQHKGKNISIFTLACFIPLVFITIFTTAQIVNWDPYETIDRIHLRYYSFLFPLFLIVASAELNSPTRHLRNAQTWTLFFFMLGGFIAANFFLSNHFKLSFIDCPELFGLFYNRIILVALSLIGISCLFTWIIHEKWGIRLYLFIFIPSLFLIASYYVHFELTYERLAMRDAYDDAGQFAHRFLQQNTSQLVVIGPERAGLYKTLFYIDNPATQFSELPEHLPIEFAKIPPKTTWLLIIGDYLELRKPVLRIASKNFTLLKIDKRSV